VCWNKGSLPEKNGPSFLPVTIFLQFVTKISPFDTLPKHGIADTSAYKIGVANQRKE
jgi:hypothetical protein